MFGEQFYPTPDAVIEKMLAPYGGQMHKGGINGHYHDCKAFALHDKVILDPSAGSGRILKYIQKDLHDNAVRKEFELYAFEIDPNLQAILKEEKFSLLGSDFLSYEQDTYFDVILMNPPFKNGDEHLLKAIEIAHDTDIICLLNADTLLNPHTNRRKQLLEKVERYGSFEILGNVFANAERKTDVNVALVRLHVKKEGSAFDFDFSDHQPEKVVLDDTFKADEIARMDKIGNMIVQFEQLKEAHKEFIEAERKLQHYAKPLLSGRYDRVKDIDNDKLNPLKRHNYFNSRIKRRIWRDVIRALELERYMTNSVRKNFDQFIQEQGAMAFSKKNVHDLFNLLVTNSSTILEQSITEVFEMLTANYYSENRMYVEGWKTNDRYKVSRRVIAPMYVRYGEYMNSHDLKEWGDKFSLSYSGTHKYSDIDKMLCYISGKQFEQVITIGRALENHFQSLGRIKTGDKYSNKCSSTFFDIKFYKKGTVHLYFRDKFLWQEFNMRACDQKQWLPDNERTQWQEKKARERQEKENREKGILPLDAPETHVKTTLPKKTTKRRAKNDAFSKQLFDLFSTQS